MVDINNIGNIGVAASNHAVKAEHDPVVKKKSQSDAPVVVKQKSEGFDTDVKKTASEVNSRLKHLNTNLRVEVDSASKQVIIKIVDSQTNEVVRQFPSEEMIEVARRLGEAIDRYDRDPQDAVNIFNEL